MATIKERLARGVSLEGDMARAKSRAELDEAYQEHQAWIQRYYEDIVSKRGLEPGRVVPENIKECRLAKECKKLGIDCAEYVGEDGCSILKDAKSVPEFTLTPLGIEKIATKTGVDPAVIRAFPASFIRELFADKTYEGTVGKSDGIPVWVTAGETCLPRAALRKLLKPPIGVDEIAEELGIAPSDAMILTENRELRRMCLESKRSRQRLLAENKRVNLKCNELIEALAKVEPTLAKCRKLQEELSAKSRELQMETLQIKTEFNELLEKSKGSKMSELRALAENKRLTERCDRLYEALHEVETLEAKGERFVVNRVLQEENSQLRLKLRTERDSADGLYETLRGRVSCLQVTVQNERAMVDKLRDENTRLKAKTPMPWDKPDEQDNIILKSENDDLRSRIIWLEYELEHSADASVRLADYLELQKKNAELRSKLKAAVTERDEMKSDIVTIKKLGCPGFDADQESCSVMREKATLTKEAFTFRGRLTRMADGKRRLMEKNARLSENICDVETHSNKANGCIKEAVEALFVAPSFEYALRSAQRKHGMDDPF